jgi:hypothetical protein
MVFKGIRMGMKRVKGAVLGWIKEKDKVDSKRFEEIVTGNGFLW